MGCDSHLAIEYRPYGDKNGRCEDYWYIWALDITQDRNYRMFAAMANVRNYLEPEIIPIAEPRGFPERSEAGDWLTEHAADHSYTWLTPREYYEAYKRAGEPNGDDNFSKSWLVLKETLEILSRNYGEENVRLLVGFDN